MSSDRRTAITVGVLFILATAASLVSTGLTAPYLGGADYLTRIAQDADRMIAGGLFAIAAAVSVALIAAVLFPVLKRYGEGLALGYLVMRVLEGVALLADGVIMLMLVTVSRQYVSAAATERMSLQVLGTTLLGAHGWAFALDPVIFGPGALLFYYVLFRSRLVPRWLSVWGLIGAVLVTALGLLAMFGPLVVLLAIPIAVQEMVLAVWLIAKGFSVAGAE